MGPLGHGWRRAGGAWVLLLAALALPARAGEPPLSGAFASRYRAIPEPELVPDYAFQEGGGREWGMVEFRGRVVVAMFWATWCPVCAREMPNLDRLQAELGDEGLLVVALSQDRGGPEVAARWLEERDLDNLRPFHDPRSVLARVIGINGVPTAFVIDKQGRMVGVVEGPGRWDTPEAEALLRHYLGAASDS